MSGIYLKSWRNVIEPRDEVAQGRFTQSEFAADLGQVIRGECNNIEYADADEFFSRTYLTSGLKKLLVTTLKRLSKGDGDPIIQLKTSFGGGKTHSLLALYHLFGGKIRDVQKPMFGEIFKGAGVSSLPEVHTAVIVGTRENPLKSTLWGEIAKQLAKSTGKPELYEMIRDNDEQKIAPGSDLLQEIFNEAGACLILIDELVAYGRTLSEGKNGVGGTFENFQTFIQQLTEAAKTSAKTSLVVSIPESENEIGDQLGWRVQEKLANIFRRVEFIWSPISVSEAYEIVRRRLFKPCHDEREREKVCAAFFDMYLNNRQDFPNEVSKSNYKEKLLACYPIHPQLFDFLYGKWTSLNRFQKTRGVLRLMANVIFSLWDNHDMNTLIMPGTIPLKDSSVRDELTDILEEKGNWDAIVQSEIDGKQSKAYNLDKDNMRFQKFSAAQKISRSIFIGTAPDPKTGNVRGITENEIHLYTIQPQDIESIAVFNDALTKLRTNLYYLYSTDSRFWFDVTATLRKVIDEKREKYSDAEIFAEIEKRIRTWKRGGEFKAIYVCPKNSAEVPDEQTARLVILSPKNSFDATNAAQEILKNRGTILRTWKNMLLFLAADANKIEGLKDVMREFKAWSDVKAEAEILNLTAVQVKEVDKNIESSEKTFAIKISQAYCRLIYPVSDENANLTLPLKDIEIDECTNEENIAKVLAKCKYDELILPALGGEGLKRLLDERKFILSDKDSINVNKLWECFAQYYYMQRLVDEKVLFDAIRHAVKDEIFALVDDENFSNLQFGEDNASVSGEKFLVKASKAQELRAYEKKDSKPTSKTINSTQNEQSEESQPEVEALSTKFIMDTILDNTRYVKHFSKCMDELAEPLLKLSNAKMELQIIVNISIPEGIPAETRETIEANCRALKIRNFYFEK